MINPKETTMTTEAMTAILEIENDLVWKVEHAHLEATQERAAFASKAQRDDDGDASDMAGRLPTREAIERYVEGGNARFTVRSKKTGARFTFRASRPKEEPGRVRPIWFSVLNGPDNGASYAFIGTCFLGPNGWTLRPSAKSRVKADAPSAKALQWLFKALNGATSIDQAEVWHEGRCGRCGRVLTVPESISSGFGPECITKIGG